MEKVKFLEVANGKATFKVGHKTVSMNELSTEAFLEEDIGSLYGLYVYESNDLVDARWDFEKKMARSTNEMMDKEVEDPGSFHTFTRHVNDLKRKMAFLETQGDLVLAIRAGIEILKNEKEENNG